MDRNIWDAQVLLPECTILQAEYILDGKLAHINSQVLVMVKTEWFQEEAATTWEGLNNVRHWICFHKLGCFKQQRAVLAVWTPKVWKQKRNNSRGSGRQSLFPSSSFWRFWHAWDLNYMASVCLSWGSRKLPFFSSVDLSWTLGPTLVWENFIVNSIIIWYV